MPEKGMTLSPGEWAVLGLLIERPRHGFALAKAMARNGALGRVWLLPTPLVYRAISTLQTKGLATVVGAERSDIGPQRHLVAPTEEGREQLLEWLATPVDHLRDVRSLLMLKLALLAGMQMDPEPLLRRQRERFRPLLAGLERQVAEADEGFDRALSLWRLESARAAIRFLEQAPELVRVATSKGSTESAVPRTPLGRPSAGL